MTQPLNLVSYDRRAPPPPPARRRLHGAGTAATVLGRDALYGGTPGPHRALLQLTTTDPYLFGSSCQAYTTRTSLYGFYAGISVVFRHRWAGAEAAARAYAESLVKAGTPAWLYAAYPGVCLARVELVQWACTYG